MLQLDNLLALRPGAALREIISDKLAPGHDASLFDISPPSRVTNTWLGVGTNVELSIDLAQAPVQYWGYTTPVTFQYNRIPAGYYFGQRDMRFVVDFPIFVGKVIQLISQRHNVVIELDEYDDRRIEEDEEGDIAIAVKPESYRFVGEIPVTLVLRVKPLSEVVTVVDLGQLTYPVAGQDDADHQTLILRQINQLNQLALNRHPLESSWLRWRFYTPLDDGGARYTLEMLDNRYYSGQVQITYLRRDLQQTVGAGVLRIVSSATGTRELVEDIILETGVFLLRDDIVQEPLPQGPSGQVDYVTLTATPGSSLYRGSMTVELVKP
ncbi:hypothetical protein ACLPJK_25800 [Pseudomonas aeruginosa]|uniref:DUF7941 domain-family protein n=1 Tax=Pseudomonas aeruginosa TaxID=287 RepID=UPI003D2E1575